MANSSFVKTHIYPAPHYGIWMCSTVINTFFFIYTFLNSSDNGREVVVSKHHLSGGFSDSGTGAHGNTNFGLLQGGGVIHTVTSLQ